MINVKNRNECCGCGACEQICPKKCITMKTDKEGFLYPVVNQNNCINCGLCEKACQYANLSKKKDSPLAQYYFINEDDDIRKKSSSGGVFICLAEETIKKGGVVFGASFDKNFDVEISYAQTLDECWKFVGSKYVQAKVGNAYKQAKSFLNENRLVFFSGTPCQINGLQHYLGKEYDNLIKMDFTCHAIPSPMIWSKYLKSIKGTCSIKSVNFRDKEVSGWNNYGLTIMGECSNTEKKLVSEGNKQNTYMKGFLQYLYDRPSCSNCVSRNFASASDIMIGDFWNVEKYHSESFFNDNKGVSIAMAVSEKGKNVLDTLGTYGKMGEIALNEMEMDKSHDCILKSAPQHPFRNVFFSLNRIGMPLKMNIWLCLEPLSFAKRLLRPFKRMIKKL